MEEEGVWMIKHQKALNIYKQTSILSASTEKLIIKIIDKALTAIDHASNAIEANELVVQNESIQIAQECMLQLMTFIAGEDNEGEKIIILFDYLNRQLVKANMTKDQELLNEVTAFLLNQKEDWQMALENRMKKYSGNYI